MAFSASTIADLNSPLTDLANGDPSLLRHVTDYKSFVIYVLVLEANDLFPAGIPNPTIRVGNLANGATTTDLSGYVQGAIIFCFETYSIVGFSLSPPLL